MTRPNSVASLSAWVLIVLPLQKYGIDDIRYFFTNDARLLERV